LKSSIPKIYEIAILAAKESGKIILHYYKQKLSVNIKADGSPMTIADRASHEIILEFLKETNIPVVSEEDSHLNSDASLYWLVDPLDGTKEFIDATDEFAVNIALIDDHKPIFGVIFAPVPNELYAGIPGKGAWMECNNLKVGSIGIKPKKKQSRMAISRCHNHPDIQIFAQENNINIMKPLGASLKFVYLAIGKLDVYPRLVGTSEWDTAAGQAILESAGGYVIDWNTRESLRYGKRGLRNGRFLAFRAPYKLVDYNLKDYPAVLL